LEEWLEWSLLEKAQSPEFQSQYCHKRKEIQSCVNCHYSQFQNAVITLRRNPCPSAVIPHFPQLLSPGSHQSASRVFHDSYKCNLYYVAFVTSLTSYNVFKIHPCCQVWWSTPVVLTAQETEAGELLEPGSARPAWAGSIVRLCLKKKKIRPGIGGLSL
jgi:hypothetical protein